MRLTNKELERQTYINNDPSHKVYAELVDAKDQIRCLLQQVESLELDLDYYENNQ